MIASLEAFLLDLVLFLGGGLFPSEGTILTVQLFKVSLPRNGEQMVLEEVF